MRHPHPSLFIFVFDCVVGNAAAPSVDFIALPEATWTSTILFLILVLFSYLKTNY